ncbi:MAG: ROK family protein [Bacteroidales bacterium]|jgi:glucokinase|nr:ROK family protein [Bacteroidales bacterium]
MNILTLDAGGTNFIFSAICDNKINKITILKPANGNNLNLCLNTIIDGFKEIKNKLDKKIDAISFAFPGPADYKKGIIGDLFNLPAFRGGIALSPMLEEIFQVPVFINNDGDLYAYGEALAGSLPMINKKLKDNNNSKQYNNLVGLTIGTGFGAGFVSEKHLIKGDNICAAEIWITSNRVNPEINSEEGVSIRAVKYFFSELSNIPLGDCPEPKEIFEIGCNKKHINHFFAINAYEELGHFIGDTIANMITLFDGIVVIGGGIAGAKDLIIPGIKKELSTTFHKIGKVETNPRLIQDVFCLNNKQEFENFLEVRETTIKVPFSDKEIIYDPHPRCAFMFSDYETSDMINLGAYHFALEKLKNE